MAQEERRRGSKVSFEGFLSGGAIKINIYKMPSAANCGEECLLADMIPRGDSLGSSSTFY